MPVRYSLQNKQLYCSEWAGLARGNRETQYLRAKQKDFFLAHISNDLYPVGALLLPAPVLSSCIGTKAGNSTWHPHLVLILLPGSDTCHFRPRFIDQSKSHGHLNFRGGQKAEGQNYLVKSDNVYKTAQQTVLDPSSRWRRGAKHLLGRSAIVESDSVFITPQPVG